MKKFINEKADINNPKWNNLIHREKEIYKRENDLRSDFERDYNRILHSNAYKRMKHKTQVFFSPTSDHICTRMEHVSHVDSISYTISNTLGLNTELTKAISIGHDLGHAPFGHQGERILSEISKKYIGDSFWHEKNGVNIVDNIELLEDCNSNFENMNLTYAVRDGIISHCGEIDENCIKPRNGYIDLNNYTYPNQYSPYTWEGCVVKISDKISYIIRDIEDAIYLHIIDNHLDELYDLLKYDRAQKINNSNIINTLIYDICSNSSPENGLRFSDENLKLLNDIKKFKFYVFLPEIILTSLYAVVAFLSTYALQNVLSKFVNSFPEFVSHGFEIAGGLLPGLGLALLLKVMVKKENVPYLIIGFLVMSIMKPDNVLPVALFAIALVLIDFMRDKEAKTTSVVTGGEDDGEGI